MWRKYHGIVPFGVATGSQEGGASPSPTLNGAAQDRLLDQVTRLNKKLAARLAFVIIIHKQPNYTGIRPLLFVTTLEITEASSRQAVGICSTSLSLAIAASNSNIQGSQARA